MQESTSECVSVPRSVGIDKPKHKHVRKVESGDVMIFSTPHAPAPPPWPFPSLFSKLSIVVYHLPITSCTYSDRV